MRGGARERFQRGPERLLEAGGVDSQAVNVAGKFSGVAEMLWATREN